jgi:hypothetical protein
MIWLTAATSMPSITPVMITVLWFEPLLPISPSPVFHGLGQHTEHPPKLLKLFRAQQLTDTPIEPLAIIGEAFDLDSPFLGQVHSYHALVLRVALPA